MIGGRDNERMLRLLEYWLDFMHFHKAQAILDPLE